MPQNATIVFTSGVIPEGFCHKTWQSTFNMFTSLLSGYLPGAYSTFNYGSTTPSVDDQDKPWLQLEVDGTPLGWYIYRNGEWVRAQKHPFSPGFVQYYYGDSADILTLDGGTTGNPFWRPCDGTNGMPDLRGRFLVGTGAGAGLTARTLAETGGEEKHVLTAAELAAHTHDPDSTHNNLIKDCSPTGKGVDGDSQTDLTSTTIPDITKCAAIASVGDDQAHENMPPFYALHIIMRTSRLY